MKNEERCVLKTQHRKTKVYVVIIFRILGFRKIIWNFEKFQWNRILGIVNFFVDISFWSKAKAVLKASDDINFRFSINLHSVKFFKLAIDERICEIPKHFDID